MKPASEGRRGDASVDLYDRSSTFAVDVESWLERDPAQPAG